MTLRRPRRSISIVAGARAKRTAYPAAETDISWPARQSALFTPAHFINRDPQQQSNHFRGRNLPRICALASSSVRCQISSAIGLRLSSKMCPTRPTARAITPRPRQTCHGKPSSQQIAPMAPVALIGKSRS